MDKRLCQQNVPKLTFLLKIHIDGAPERGTSVTESDAKLSYRWKKKNSRKGLLLWSFSYKDHNTTGAKQQLKGYVFCERKLDLSPSSGLQEERLWSARSACFSRDDQRRGKTVKSGNGARICKSAGELGQDLTYLLHFLKIASTPPCLSHKYCGKACFRIEGHFLPGDNTYQQTMNIRHINHFRNVSHVLELLVFKEHIYVVVFLQHIYALLGDSVTLGQDRGG